MTRTVRTLITHAENDKVGMTLGEIAAAVQVAMRADLANSTRIEVRIGFGGQIRTLMIKEERQS